MQKEPMESEVYWQRYALKTEAEWIQLRTKKKKEQFSNEHRLTSVNPIEINLLLMIKEHQKKAYISRIDWNESLVQYLHWFEW